MNFKENFYLLLVILFGILGSSVSYINNHSSKFSLKFYLFEVMTGVFMAMLVGMILKEFGYSLNIILCGSGLASTIGRDLLFLLNKKVIEFVDKKIK